MNYPNEKKLLSVVCGVYEPDEKIFEKCIKSIMNQTYKNLEIILIDDCSESGAIACEKYKKQDERIVVIHLDKNVGRSSKFVVGYPAASGEYVAYVDEDDFLELDFYEKLMDIANTRDVDVVDSGYYLHFNDSIKPKYVGEYFELNSMSEILFNIRDNIALDGCGRIIKKECIMPPEYFDVILSRVEFMKSDKFIHIPYAGYHYIKRENTASTNQRLTRAKFNNVLVYSNKDNIAKTLKLYPFLDTVVYVWSFHMLLSIYARYASTAKPYSSDEQLMIQELHLLINSMGKIYLKNLNFKNKILFLALKLKILYFPLKFYMIKKVPKNV